MQEGGPVAHVMQSMPFHKLLRDARAIILDGKHQAAVDLAAMDQDMPGLGVAHLFAKASWTMARICELRSGEYPSEDGSSRSRSIFTNEAKTRIGGQVSQSLFQRYCAGFGSVQLSQVLSQVNDRILQHPYRGRQAALQGRFRLGQFLSRLDQQAGGINFLDGAIMQFTSDPFAFI